MVASRTSESKNGPLSKFDTQSHSGVLQCRLCHICMPQTFESVIVLLLVLSFYLIEISKADSVNLYTTVIKKLTVLGFNG